MVVSEQSWGDFMKRIESDMYVRNGIWDFSKTQFLPFRTVMRV